MVNFKKEEMEEIEKTHEFDSAFKKLLKIEGDYVNDLSDSGGKTRYGITEAVARKNGYTGSMEKLPLEIAEYIYKKDYWDVLQLDLLPSDYYNSLKEELFDSAVNVGTKQTILWAQRALNALNNKEKYWDDVKEDGVVGPNTIHATKTAMKVPKWKNRLVKTLNCLQGAFYITLVRKREKDERFIGGWLDMRVKI